MMHVEGAGMRGGEGRRYAGPGMEVRKLSSWDWLREPERGGAQEGPRDAGPTSEGRAAGEKSG